MSSAALRWLPRRFGRPAGTSRTTCPATTSTWVTPFARDGALRLVDIGDVPYEFGAREENRRRTLEVISEIARQGAMPLAIGGDDSIPPMLA